MQITFIQRHKVKQGDGNGPVYELGKTYEFKGPVSETYARKYIARGFAVEAVKEAPKPVVKEAAPAVDFTPAVAVTADIAPRRFGKVRASE